MSTTSERLIEAYAAVATTDHQRNFVASLNASMFPLQINNAARGYFTDNEVNQVNDFAFDTAGQRSPEIATLAGQPATPEGAPPEGAIPEGANPTGAPQLGDFGDDAGLGNFITVPPDYFAVRYEADPLPPGQVGPMPVRSVEVAPRYRSGDEYSLFTGLSTEETAMVQNQLIRAGLLEPSVTRFGVWDPASAAAAKDALGFANIQGLEIDQALQILIDTPLPEEATRDLDLQPFQRPNRAETEADIADLFETKMRRRPTRAELDDLADFWEDRLRLSFDDDENRRYYEERISRRITEGVDENVLRAETDALSELQPEMSPEAAFDEFFNQRFGDTINRNEARDQGRHSGLDLSNLFRFLGNA